MGVVSPQTDLKTQRAGCVAAPGGPGLSSPSLSAAGRPERAVAVGELWEGETVDLTSQLTWEP